MDVSSVIVVGIVCGILIYGLIKRTDVASAFTKGAEDGLRTAFGLLPTLCFVTLSVAALRASGILEMITGLLSPLAGRLGIPVQCLPLALLRPISGSGALTLLGEILKDCGPDSFAGRTASVMAASTETTFYTVAIYFGAVKAKRSRKAVIAALAGDITAFFLSVFAVRIILG